MQAAPSSVVRGNMKQYYPLVHALVFAGIVLSAFTPGLFQTEAASAAVIAEPAPLPVSSLPAPWFALSLACIALSLGGVRLLARFSN